MQVEAGAGAVAGGRIQGYRNSSPRRIRLVGLGHAGGKIATAVAGRGLPNVEVVTDARPLGWASIAAGAPDAPADMIVIVCAQGDAALLKPEPGKPAVLVTFVLLQSSANLPAVDDKVLAPARRLADLFVATCDVDYVADLIDNLAS